jgi:hypothetical protein
MKGPFFVGLLILGLTLAGAAAVADVASTSGCPRCCCTCPDDYCPKPLPCVPCAACGCCPDDYCPKPLPCVFCMPGCCWPDDYCPKPFVFCLPPCYPSWYTCGLARCCPNPQCEPSATAPKNEATAVR